MGEGRTLAHKALRGEDLPHPEAVNAYVRVFDQAVIVRHFEVSASAMTRITSDSPLFRGQCCPTLQQLWQCAEGQS